MASKGRCHGRFSWQGKRLGGRPCYCVKWIVPTCLATRSCHEARTPNGPWKSASHSVLSGGRGRAGSVLVRSRRAGSWRVRRLALRESHPSTTRDSAGRCVPLRSGRTGRWRRLVGDTSRVQSPAFVVRLEGGGRVGQWTDVMGCYRQGSGECPGSSAWLNSLRLLHGCICVIKFGESPF